MALHLESDCFEIVPVAGHCYCCIAQLAAVAQSILPCLIEAALNRVPDLLRREYIDQMLEVRGITSLAGTSGIFLSRYANVSEALSLSITGMQKSNVD